MEKINSNKKQLQQGTARAYDSYTSWKKEMLPDLVKEEEYKSLSFNPDELAKKLADESFNRVRQNMKI